MRLTIFIGIIYLLASIYTLIHGRFFDAISMFILLFFAVENFFLRSRLKKTKELRNFFGKMTTDELNNIEERIKTEEEEKL